MKDFSREVFRGWEPKGTTMVEASAGTGKTFNIQSAYLRLVLEGYPVTGILVVTFTDAATAELRERLRGVLEECRAELEAPSGKGRTREALEGARRRGAEDGELKKRVRAALDLYDRASIYTIHGFCNHVLTQYAFEAGHESDGELLQNTDGAVLDASRDWWRANMYGAEGKEEDDGAFAGGFKDFREKVRQRLGHPDAVVEAGPEGAALDAAAAIYARQRRERNELTYDAMLTDLREALRGDAAEVLKAAVRKDYRAALVDEFQDTDRIQYEIFQTLFADGETPLLFVGDPKQAIYRFRGGDIFTYKAAKAAVGEERRWDLETNYRSEAGLLESINAYFGERTPGETFLDAAIPYKPLESGAAERGLAVLKGVEGGRFVLWTAEYQNKAEMEGRAYGAVADEIVRLLEDERAVLEAPPEKAGGKPETRRLRPGDFAVLMGKNKECEAMLDVLRERGVNAVCVRDSDLRNTAAAKGMRWLLRAMASPGDVPALRAALGIAFMPSTKGDLEALSRGETREAVSEWGQILWRAGESWERDGFMRAWKILKDEMGLQRRILEQEDGEQLAADLEQTAEWLHLQGRMAGGGAQGLLRAYEAWLDAAGEEKDGESGDGGGEKRRIADDAPAVKVMTIHKSKGLQFPVVFVPMSWGKSFGEKGRDQDGKKKVFYIYHKDGVECLGENQEASRAEEEAEARRQAYVALTRAMNRVYLVDARKKERTTVSALTNAWRGRGGEGGIEEAPLPETVGVVYAGRGEAAELEAARPMPKADRGNGRTSFSGMTRDMHGGRTSGDGTDAEAQDRDESDGEEDPESGGGGGAVRTGIFALPGGTQTGLCIHGLFELLDFGDAATHEETIGRMLKRYGLEAHREAVRRMVGAVLGTELPGGGGKLRDAKTRIAEMTFDFPMRRTEAATLRGMAEVLEEHWVGEEAWKREFVGKLRTAGAAERAIARGYMTGAIDLVFRAGGKFHLADWKTNRLDGKPENFGTAGLREEMKTCLYPLQYLVYLTALDGILRERLEGYDYDKDIGNAYYLFVRGMDGTGRGVFVDRPGRETVEALRDYLQGGGR